MNGNQPEPTLEQKEQPLLRVTFEEQEDGSVIASFPALKGSKPFTVQLYEPTWEMIDDVHDLTTKKSVEGEESDKEIVNLKDITNFFRKYIVGGPGAVPIRHTRTVFEAVGGYVKFSMQAATKN
jgi:hypothetical protein